MGQSPPPSPPTPAQGPTTRQGLAVKLRPIVPEDAPSIQVLLEHLADLAATNLPEVIHPDAGANYVRMAAGGWEVTQWAPSVIELEGRFAGLIVLEPDALCVTGEWVLFYYVHPDLWGRGVATAAVRLMLELAFREIGLNSVCARCLSDHAPSLKVLHKTGFKEVERLRNEGRFGTRTVGQAVTVLRLTRQEHAQRSR